MRVSKFPSEPKLRTNQEDTTAIDIQDLQADEFARNFNPPLTNLSNLVIVQVIPFDSPVIGVLVSNIMAIFGEGISTPKSVILARGV